MRINKWKRLSVGASLTLSLLIVSPTVYAHGEKVLFSIIFAVAATYLVQIVFLIWVRTKLIVKWQCGMAIVAASVLSYLYFIWFTGEFFEDIAIFILLSALSWVAMLYLIYFRRN